MAGCDGPVRGSVPRVKPRRSYQLGKRAEQVERTRARVIGVARDRFVRDGFQRLTLEDVAEDAGVTKPTIYKQFGSKLGLIEAVALDLADRGGEERMVEATSAPNPSDACRDLIIAFCRFWSVDPDLIAQLVSMAVLDASAGKALGERERDRYDMIESVVARLANQGRVRSKFSAAEATALIGALTDFSSYLLMSQHLVLGPDEVATVMIRLTDHIVRLEA